MGRGVDKVQWFTRFEGGWGVRAWDTRFEGGGGGGEEGHQWFDY